MEHTIPQPIPVVEQKPESVPKKRPRPSKPSSSQKKPRFNKPFESKTTFESKTIPKSLSLTPLKRFFQLHTSSINLSYFFSTIYTVIINRDSKFSATSVETFNYVCHIAFYYRLYNLGESLSYSFSSRTSKLKRYAEALILPEAVCKLVESLGSVKMSNGITVVPYIPTNSEYYNSGFYTTLESLAQFIDGIERDSLKSALNSDLILQYIASTTRGFKANMIFRKVMYDLGDGAIEYTAATTTESNCVRAAMMQESEEVVAFTGGTYNFRDLANSPQWLGTDKNYFSYPFISSTFEPALQISSKMINELNK